jgi:hypothetical protein
VDDAGQRAIVLAVADLFLAASIDEIVAYADIQKMAAGYDVQGSDRWIILQALKTVNKNNGVVFSTERGTGYRRLDSEAGIKYAGVVALKRTRSAARNGRQKLENAVRVGNDLPHEEGRLANQRLSTLGLVEHLTKDRIVRVMPDDNATKGPEDHLSALRKALGF